MDGSIDVWDTMFKQTNPTLTVQVSNSPIQSVKVQDFGRLVAVGARDGTTTLVELSESLYKLQPNEKSVFSAVSG
jgi:dynein intermediate chain 2